MFPTGCFNKPLGTAPFKKHSDYKYSFFGNKTVLFCENFGGHSKFYLKIARKFEVFPLFFIITTKIEILVFT